jgi:hypothetical protein
MIIPSGVDKYMQQCWDSIQQEVPSLCESNNFLCSNTLPLLVLAIQLTRRYPEFSKMNGISIELQTDRALYVPDSYDKVRTRTSHTADWVILKRGIGTSGAGIAYCQELSAIFVVREADGEIEGQQEPDVPQDPIVVIDRLLNAKVLNTQVLNEYLFNASNILITRDPAELQEVFDFSVDLFELPSVFDIELLENALALLGITLAVNSIPLTVRRDLAGELVNRLATIGSQPDSQQSIVVAVY